MNLRKLLNAFKDETSISIAEIQRRMGVGYLTAGKYLVELLDKKYEAIKAPNGISDNECHKIRFHFLSFFKKEGWKNKNKKMR